MPDEEERLEYPAPVGVPEETIPSAEVEEEKDELADLFEVPKSEDNDMTTDHLVDVDEEEDLSDLTTVTEEDIIGSPPAVRKKKYRIARPTRQSPPPTTLGGVGY